MHACYERCLLGDLSEGLLASLDCKRRIDIHRSPRIGKRGLNSRNVHDVPPDKNRRPAAADSVTGVAGSMTREWHGIDARRHFAAFDQACAVRIRRQHLPDELESLAIRDFVQIALQPKRCLCAVQDNFCIWKSGIALRIDKSAAMIAMEVGEKNGLDQCRGDTGCLEGRR